MLYEVAILKKPTDREKARGVREVLIYGPTPVVADTPDAARIAALTVAKVEGDPNRMEVLLRPFCQNR